jgi:hypothetical protein
LLFRCKRVSFCHLVKVRRVEGGGWREEGGGWRVEGGGWREEEGGRRVEGGGHSIYLANRGLLGREAVACW